MSYLFPAKGPLSSLAGGASGLRGACLAFFFGLVFGDGDGISPLVLAGMSWTELSPKPSGTSAGLVSGAFFRAFLGFSGVMGSRAGFLEALAGFGPWR